MAEQLLDIQPRPLRFGPFELDTRMQSTLTLQNTTDAHCAFRVRVTAPNKYSVKPCTGVLAPRERRDVAIAMAAQSAAPPAFGPCRDRFQVLAVPVGAGEPAAAEVFQRPDVKSLNIKVELREPASGGGEAAQDTATPTPPPLRAPAPLQQQPPPPQQQAQQQAAAAKYSGSLQRAISKRLSAPSPAAVPAAVLGSAGPAAGGSAGRTATAVRAGQATLDPSAPSASPPSAEAAAGAVAPNPGAGGSAGRPAAAAAASRRSERPAVSGQGSSDESYVPEGDNGASEMAEEDEAEERRWWAREEAERGVAEPGVLLRPAKKGAGAAKRAKHSPAAPVAQAAAAPGGGAPRLVAELRRQGALPAPLALAVLSAEGALLARFRVATHALVGAMLRALEEQAGAPAGGALFLRGRRLGEDCTAKAAGLRDGDLLELRA